MVQVKFAIILNPRFLSQLKAAGDLSGVRASDRFLRESAKDIKELAQEEAPERTGFLKSRIKVKSKRKSGGGVDRRANFRIESTASYSRHVITGVRPSTGDGSPGSGAYFGPGGYGFPATGGNRGSKRFRSAYGYYPGFAGNDFMGRAVVRSQGYLEDLILPIAIKSTTESYNKLGIRFGR